MIGTLAYEFPDYPAESVPADIPAWLAPSHWHNDSCPCWYADLSGNQVCLYIDYADTTLREVQGNVRVVIFVNDTPYLGSDDWREVLDHLAHVRATIQETP